MEHTQVAVVGGGVAGTTAARTAAELGLKVVLIDEHPLDADSMAMDIPQFFGQRALGHDVRPGPDDGQGHQRERGSAVGG